MMGNQIQNSFKVTALDKIELNRKEYAYYCIDQSKFMHNRPTMAKIILNIMNPETRVNIHDLKKKISNASIDEFKGDVKKMFTCMKLLCDNIISKNERYNDLMLDILKALYTIQDKLFLVTVEKIQDEYNSRATLSTHDVIKHAITKYNNFLNCKIYYYKESIKKYLNFSIDRKTPPNK